MKVNKKSHPYYSSWAGMRKRCNQKNSKDFKLYGAAGITICKEWNDFWRFVKDIGERPTKDHCTIDRIDPKGNYEPSNCRWATRLEQSQNTKRKYGCTSGLHKWTKKNTIWTHNGKNKTRRCKACFEKRIAIEKRNNEDVV